MPVPHSEDWYLEKPGSKNTEMWCYVIGSYKINSFSIVSHYKVRHLIIKTLRMVITLILIAAFCNILQRINPATILSGCSVKGYVCVGLNNLSWHSVQFPGPFNFTNILWMTIYGYLLNKISF